MRRAFVRRVARRMMGVVAMSLGASIAAAGPSTAATDWADVSTPIVGAPARAYGEHTRGCLDGAVALPLDGVGYQVMRPERNRFWGHPVLVAYIERLAADVAAQGWPGLLVGDLAQPRGGPTPTSHRSHQTGLDVDIWFAAAPARTLSPSERAEMSAPSVVEPGGYAVGGAWTDGLAMVLRTAAEDPEVDRIFVNPAIKRELCRTTGEDRAWLARIRPWWGHDDHFHVRLHCPVGEPDCVEGQSPVPAGDGCGAELDWWFSAEARGETGKPPPPPRPRPTLADLPTACRLLLEAP